MEYFYFYRDSKHLKLSNNEKILRIPRNIYDEASIFEFYDKTLNIPENYGKNWDAFFDNLKCLSFINERNVIALHEDIPLYNKNESKRIYIEILFDTVRHWWEFPQHKFYVYFPENCREEVVRIVENRGYE